MFTREYDCSVTISPADDVPGTWVAHCLEFDVVTQGDTPEHALQMIYEAVSMVVCDDLERGADPNERRAPDSEWALLSRIREDGGPVQFADAARAALDSSAHCRIALNFQLAVEEASAEALESHSLPSYMLPCGDGHGTLVASV